MDRKTDGETNTLASRGLEEPAHASRGLEEPFFQLCCCVSFWFWKTLDLGGKGGKSSWATKMCSLQTEKLSRNWRSRKMHWCLAEVPTVGKKLSRNRRRPDDCLYSMVPFTGSGDYDRKKKFQSSVWRVVLLCQFLVLAITTGKKV